MVVTDYVTTHNARVLASLFWIGAANLTRYPTGW